MFGEVEARAQQCDRHIHTRVYEELHTRYDVRRLMFMFADAPFTIQTAVVAVAVYSRVRSRAAVYIYAYCTYIHTCLRKRPLP